MSRTFGRWLKEKRKELGLAQEELAERIGCSVSMLWKLESGERQPSSQIAQLLADYLHIPNDEREAFILFARSGQSAPPSPRSSEGYRPRPAEALSSAAPWRTAYRHRTNLPASLTPFIGREGELAAARDLLLNPRIRLLTMVGPPGIGKTRLALQAAYDLLQHMEDGVFFVDLAPISDPLLVLPAVARSLGLADEGKGGLPVERLLLNHLRDKKLLLLLDNFEQVLDAAYLLTGLLEGSPWLKILTTSRESLRIKGERRFPVPPLELPELQHLPPPSGLARYSSMELFVERARMTEPDFALSEQNAGAVVSICVHLDGLPLAIELAAGQVGFLSPQEIEERLTRRLQLLKAWEQHLPERQRSLRGAIDSSYYLLGEQEKRLFRRLGIFKGGFTLEAAKAVCGDPATRTGAKQRRDHDPDVAENLRALLDKNLVSQTETARAERRFAMLETIREYALDHLHGSGEAEATGERHAEYFLSLAQEGAANLRGPQQARWLDTFATEHDNLNAALGTLFAPERETTQEDEQRKKRELERVETGARLCMALYLYWEMRNDYNEGRRWFRHAIERIQGLIAPPGSGQADASAIGPVDLLTTGRLSSELSSLLGTMYSGAGLFAYFQSNYREAQGLHEASLAIRRQLGDKVGIASSAGNLGNIAMEQGDYALARRYHAENLSIARELGNDLKTSISLSNLGIVECDTGNFAQARSLYEEALAIGEKLEDADHTARILNNLGIVMRYQGDYIAARKVLDRALAMQAGLDTKRNAGHTMTNIGFLERDQGNYEEARRYFLEALAAEWDAGDSRVAAECLEGLASIEAATGDAEEAARLFGCAEATREDIQTPVTPAERTYREAYIEQARTRLDDARWNAAWDSGRATSFDELVTRLLAPRQQAIE